MLRWILKLNKSKKIVAKQIFFVVAVFLFTSLFFPLAGQVNAAPDNFGLQQIEEDTLLGGQDIRLTIAKIIRAILGFLGIVVLVLMIYAGYIIMTAGGNETKVATGKKILINATIGLAIVLSSFAITQFVLNKLGEATGFAGFGPAGGPPSPETFIGSGSLGQVIRDHYPFRDQRDVPRNTRISVTFNEALDPESVFVDNNTSGILGDCINTDQPDFDWNTDCDHLTTDAISVLELNEEDLPIGSALDMVAIASFEGGLVYSVVLRPVAPLGSDSDNVGYSVDLTDEIMKEDGSTNMFENDRDGHYEWQFETGTEFDFTPPYVASVYPIEGQTVARNTIIQINFNEAMDPVMAQGAADVFYNIIFGDTGVTGVWRIANAYKTVEFVSDQQCGLNSCGDPMYCLPSSCLLGDEDCFEARNVLARTASLISASSFESVPFSGLMDMSGNALDGDNDGTPDGKPAMPGDFHTVGFGEDAPDNYLWNFQVQNTIDRTAPYVVQITPGIDEEDVPEDAEHTILFSKLMWSFTLGAIAVEEYDLGLPFWYRVTADTVGDGTLVTINHRIFGPNNEDAYYFTSIPTEVKSLNQNCVYPGRGPVIPGVPCEQDINGDIVGGTCVPTSYNSSEDTGCVQTTGGALLQSNIEECLDNLEILSPL